MSALRELAITFRGALEASGKEALRRVLEEGQPASAEAQKLVSSLEGFQALVEGAVPAIELLVKDDESRKAAHEAVAQAVETYRAALAVRAAALESTTESAVLHALLDVGARFGKAVLRAAFVAAVAA